MLQEFILAVALSGACMFGSVSLSSGIKSDFDSVFVLDHDLLAGEGFLNERGSFSCWFNIYSYKAYLGKNFSSGQKTEDTDPRLIILADPVPRHQASSPWE